MAVVKTVLESKSKFQEGDVIAVATFDIPNKRVKSIKDINGLDFVKEDLPATKLANFNAVEAAIKTEADTLFA